MNWERRDRNRGWRVDLAQMADLVTRLGRPDRAYRVVHVAGSKGKGSVASLVGASLQQAGHRVGTYGSPHVESILERIRIDGECAGPEEFVVAATEVLDAVDRAGVESAPAGDASWFDVMTATAFVLFRNAGIDWSVLEVGLGGRLDSTNVIDPPVVAVVTSIALEHTNILGATHAEIAAEKAGIVKAGSVLVTGCDPRSDAGTVIARHALERAVPLVAAFDAGDETFEQRNVRTARAVLHEIERATSTPPLALDDVTIDRARLPGRMEWRMDPAGRTVLFDGAHVPESMASAWREARRATNGPCIVIAAIHSEKDARALLARLRGPAPRGLFATSIPGSGVHLPAAEVAGAAEQEELEVLGAFDAPLDAMEAARTFAEPLGEDAWIFVTGSLYLVGALRAGTAPRAKTLPTHTSDPRETPGPGE